MTEKYSVELFKSRQQAISLSLNFFLFFWKADKPGLKVRGTRSRVINKRFFVVS